MKGRRKQWIVRVVVVGASGTTGELTEAVFRGYRECQGIRIIGAFMPDFMDASPVLCSAADGTGVWTIIPTSQSPVPVDILITDLVRPFFVRTSVPPGFDVNVYFLVQGGLFNG